MKAVHFPSKNQANPFNECLKDEKATSTRVIAALGALLFLVYSVMDYFGLPQETLIVLYSIRTSVIIVLVIIFALTYKPIFQKRYNEILMFGYFYSGLGISVGVYFSQPGEYSFDIYFAALMILAMTAFSWSYLPIKYSLFVSVFFVAVYITIKIFHHKDYDGTRFLTLISHVFYLISVGVIAATSQYIRDRLILKNFLLQQQPQLKAEEKTREAERQGMLANMDALTGIPNRRSITESLREAIIEAKESEAQLTLVFIDLNGFKKINDNYGHDSGDKVLEITAKRLAQTIRNNDYLARLGGDEFLIAFKTLRVSSKLKHDFNNKIKANISAPIVFKGHHLTVGASLGFASYPQDGHIIEDLIKIADKNMYIDKQRSKRVQVPSLSAVKV